ncbi:MAG: ribonuclease III [Alphaproteobacteria bacterium]|nr:ribonuclease III [Alphaproteobacteria bacterium]
MTKELAAALQYEFSDSQVLATALTHGSAASKPDDTYERLEFLGDRVLSLAIAELLFNSYPDENEGKLARRYVALVRRETLADVATELGLGAYIVMSQSEADAGGRENPSLLADVCEAVIAAIYLDGGLAPAVSFIQRYWRDRMNQSDKPPLDAKTALQEWAQGRGLPLPAYEIVERTGPDHAPTFTIAVSVGDSQTGQGEGSTRRAAEQAAAEVLLEMLTADD